MKISFDEAKRQATLMKRGLDMSDAALVLSGVTLDAEDKRQDYGERRIVSVGHLHGRMVAIVWTPRPDGRRIISMRKCNDREQKTYGPKFP